MMFLLADFGIVAEATDADRYGRVVLYHRIYWKLGALSGLSVPNSLTVL